MNLGLFKMAINRGVYLHKNIGPCTSKTPRSILVKMMYSRITKIRELTKQLNLIIANMKAIEQTNPSYYISKPLKREPVTLHDMDTITTVRAYKGILASYHEEWNLHVEEAKDLFRDIENIIKRPNYDESVLRDAWNLIIVGEIYES
jgi:hypothetical protein